MVTGTSRRSRCSMAHRGNCRFREGSAAAAGVVLLLCLVGMVSNSTRVPHERYPKNLVERESYLFGPRFSLVCELFPKKLIGNHSINQLNTYLLVFRTMIFYVRKMAHESPLLLYMVTNSRFTSHSPADLRMLSTSIERRDLRGKSFSR